MESLTTGRFFPDTCINSTGSTTGSVVAVVLHTEKGIRGMARCFNVDQHVVDTADSTGSMYLVPGTTDTR